MTTTPTAQELPAGSPAGQPIPGPRGHPLLGSILDIQRDNIDAFMTAWRRYGDIVHFRGPLTINLLVHPDHVKRVLQDNHRNYPRPGFVQDKLKSIVGDGLVANEGEVWRRSRRLTQPAFHRRHIDDFVSMFADTTADMIERWEGQARSGRPLDIKSEMMRLSLSNLAKALFRTDWRSEVERVEPAVAFLLAHTNRRLTSPVDPQRFRLLPSAKRFERALADLDDIIDRLIAERRHSAGDGGDLVSMLMAARDEDTGEGMSDRQIRDEVAGFFIAGHETVSSALTWTWYLLSKNPDCWRRVCAEAAEVLDGRAPTAADLPDLRYTTMVLQESMRLYPPIFVLMRCAAEDDEVDGYRVPAGSNIVLCPYVTHRHPDFWPNAEGFDPERFRPERVAERHRMAYFPFAGGPRKCIGDSFAMVQMPVVVAMVAQRFALDLVPGQPVVPQPAISLRPRDGMHMTLRAHARSGSGGTA